LFGKKVIRKIMSQKKLMVIIGTRPEAVKLAPVIFAARAKPDRFQVTVVRTSQHKEMLDQMMKVFDIEADIDLDIMQSNQDLVHVTNASLRGLYDAMQSQRPDWVIVQGDTTTTFAGALAAFYHKIPVAHVEAGLRTGDRYQPFPEEINRNLTARLAEMHFPPTEGAKQNLLREGIDPSRILVTGNTSIDALFWVLERAEKNKAKLDKLNKKTNKPRNILVTAHRRENHGEPIGEVCRALLEILDRYPDIEVTFPVHLSPRVRETVMPLLGQHPRVALVEPLDYEEFVFAMDKATLILTDSGGVQEEAPSLGKPVLVLRENTERPEAAAAGAAILVGTNRTRIVNAVSNLLDNQEAYNAMSQVINPFGDGHAAERILDALFALNT
jgi:UDP-N-acetylglucosamine 2-epimerase (non-hydrolysing)